MILLYRNDSYSFFYAIACHWIAASYTKIRIVIQKWIRQKHIRIYAPLMANCWHSIPCSCIWNISSLRLLSKAMGSFSFIFCSCSIATAGCCIVCTVYAVYTVPSLVSILSILLLLLLLLPFAIKRKGKNRHGCSILNALNHECATKLWLLHTNEHRFVNIIFYFLWMQREMKRSSKYTSQTILENKRN